MIVRRTKIVTLAIGAAAAAALIGTTTSASAAGAAPTAPAAVTHANGDVAYSCRGANGLSTQNGWVRSTTTTPRANQPELWSWGTYSGGVDWAPDGSEMVHDATATAANGFQQDSQHTVFTSEASKDPTYAGLGFPFDYPQQDTNFANTPGIVDTDTTFTADGLDILFTRTTGGHSTIEDVPSAGWDPPIDLAQPAGDNSQPAASANGDIAFVNVAGTGPTAGQQWVWILPDGSSTPTALQQGSHPKFSPDGSLIAYVSANTVSTMTTDGNNVTAVGPATFSPATIRDFAWSPDATTFLFGLSDNTIRTAPVTAGSALTTVANGSTSCSARGEHVSWQPVPGSGHQDQVVRVWGSTRQDTSVATSKAGFPTGGSADAVVLADSYHFPDALSGAPLATFVHGPMLLTPGTGSTVWPSVLTEIDRVTADKTKPIYILGQTGSVSQAIQDQLSGLGYSNIVRLGGINRYETSLAIANFMGSGATAPEELMLATGTDFPDGLAAGAAAASYWPSSGPGGAVLLTNGNKMYGNIQTYITNALAAQTPSHHVYVTTVGGLANQAYPGTLSNPKYPAVGATRYDTSAAVAYLHFGAQTAAAFATGTSFPDALAGGAYAGSINAPLLLIPPSMVSSGALLGEVPYYVNTSSGAIATAYVFGGTGVINSTQVGQLGKAIGINTVTTGQITPTTALTAKARALLDGGSAATGKKTPRAITSRSAAGSTSAVAAR
jgi:hypothetical protein